MALWRAVQQFWLWGMASSGPPPGEAQDTGGIMEGDSGQGGYNRQVHVTGVGSGYHLS